VETASVAGAKKLGRRGEEKEELLVDFSAMAGRL
jgi:hypothetical protein